MTRHRLQLLTARQIPGSSDRGGGASSSPAPRPVDADTAPALYCRRCGIPIAREIDRIAIDGHHRHTFANPVGHVYEIGCFSAARNLTVSTDASSEFAWFAGYQWQVAVCGRCGLHLGWRFFADDHIFFGLILDRLSTGPDAAA